MESELVAPNAASSAAAAFEARFEARFAAIDARFTAFENRIPMMVNTISKLQETIPAMIAQQIAHSLRPSRRPGGPYRDDEQELGPHPRVASVQVLTCREMVPRDPVQVYEGAQNNLPDDAAMVAATAIVTLISRLQATDLLLVLISGGGSALLPLPLEPLTLKEKVATIQLLSQGGAKVQEINSVRKRLSVVKGGNLLRHTRARVVSLILSDVVDDPLEAIASGPTVPNLEDEGLALRIIDKYGLRTKVAPNVVMLLERHLHQDMNQPQTAKAFNLLIGNNKVAARAVCATARQLGYQAHLLTTSLQGEAREVGKAFALLASYLCHEEPPEGRHFSISEVTPVLQVVIVDLNMLNMFFATTKYGQCGLATPLLEKVKEKEYGLAVKLVLTCRSCGFCEKHFSSVRTQGEAWIKPFELNMRAVKGIQSIGKGSTALFDFCAALHLFHRGLHCKTIQHHLPTVMQACEQHHLPTVMPASCQQQPVKQKVLKL
ncbi:glycerate kinase [Ixodes scapularis]